MVDGGEMLDHVQAQGVAVRPRQRLRPEYGLVSALADPVGVAVIDKAISKNEYTSPFDGRSWKSPPCQG